MSVLPRVTPARVLPAYLLRADSGCYVLQPARIGARALRPTILLDRSGRLRRRPREGDNQGRSVRGPSEDVCP